MDIPGGAQNVTPSIAGEATASGAGSVAGGLFGGPSSLQGGAATSGGGAFTGGGGSVFGAPVFNLGGGSVDAATGSGTSVSPKTKNLIIYVALGVMAVVLLIIGLARK